MAMNRWIGLVALGLIASGCSSSESGEASGDGCSKNVDCKGSRVCQDAVCVDLGAGGAAASTGAGGAGGSTGSTTWTTATGSGGAGGSTGSTTWTTATGSGGAGGSTGSTSTTSTTTSTGTGGAPSATPCQSVSELADPKGLTPAMRLTGGQIAGGVMPGNGISFLEYTSVFGVSADTYPPGSADTVGFGFPGINTTTLTSWIPAGKYIAWKFRAPSNPQWSGRTGTYSTVVNPQNMAFSVAIARCPGQFDDDALYPLPNTCKGEALYLDLNWKITSGPTPACKLEPGETYYLNVIHAAPDNPSQTACQSSSCSFQIRSAHAD
jgi:hypothetical protein